MTASRLRVYPEFYGNSIENTFEEVRVDNPEYSPKEAWEFAEHLHRNHPRITAQIAQVDKLIPLQTADDIYA